MKKLTTLILSCAMACSFCACSSSSTTTTTTSKSEESSVPYSIDDFKWNVSKNSDDNEYYVTLQNNSDNDVLEYEIAYTPTVSGDQLNTLFSDIIASHGSESDVSESDTPGLYNYSCWYAAAGSTSDASKVYVAYGNFNDGYYTDYTCPTDEQFEAMEPAYLSLKIADGDTLYHYVYNIKESKWEDSSDTSTLNEWPENELTDLLPKPEGHIFNATYDEEQDQVTLNIYSPDIDYFNEYIQQLIDKGFTYQENSYESIGYAIYEDGNNHTIFLGVAQNGSLWISLSNL